MTVAPHEHEQIRQIGVWEEELHALQERIAPHFRRPEVRARAGKVLDRESTPADASFNELARGVDEDSLSRRRALALMSSNLIGGTPGRVTLLGNA